MYQGMPLSQYCKENGLCYQAIWTRIKNGKTVEEAIAPHFNLAKYCKEKDVCYGTVRLFMKQGKTLDEAIALCQENKTKKILLADGRSLAKVCLEHKILYNAVFYRVKVLKESPDDALKHFLEKQDG